MTTCTELCTWLKKATGSTHMLSQGRHIIPHANGRLLMCVEGGQVKWDGLDGYHGECANEAEVKADLAEYGVGT